MNNSVNVKSANDADLPAIAAIYAHHVLTGLATFEIEPPDVEEMRRRRADILARGLPYLVAEQGGRIAGYAYAALYRARPAYRFTVENSVYVDREQLGRGIGTALLTALVQACVPAGFRQMIAVIGDSANLASIALHARCGFERVGLLPSTGFKFGRWVDSVLMQRAIGEGDASLPRDMS
jgi:L-amino acid N-acyltransferase YncA